MRWIQPGEPHCRRYACWRQPIPVDGKTGLRWPVSLRSLAADQGICADSCALCEEVSISQTKIVKHFESDWLWRLQ